MKGIFSCYISVRLLRDEGVCCIVFNKDLRLLIASPLWRTTHPYSRTFHRAPSREGIKKSNGPVRFPLLRGGGMCCVVFNKERRLPIASPLWRTTHPYSRTFHPSLERGSKKAMALCDSPLERGEGCVTMFKFRNNQFATQNQLFS
nr:hypothetical protein [Mucilaginibacter sp. FT3.2]